MEAKEKALELFDKTYHNIVYHSNGHKKSKIIAKICTIIAINEIIKVFYFINPNCDDLILLEELNRWKKIKQEIENI